jgi:hypothetical protein
MEDQLNIKYLNIDLQDQKVVSLPKFNHALNNPFTTPSLPRIESVLNPQGLFGTKLNEK